MTHRYRIFAAIVLALLGSTGAGCDRFESRIIERMAARALTGDHTELLNDDKLHVVLCGTGSPLADADGASACTAVIAGGHFVLVDVGPGSWRQVALHHLPRAHLEAVLITHFHSDHIGELGEAVMQSWVSGRRMPLAVYGPPGIAQVVDGFQQAYAFDTQYRVAHHGSEAMPSEGGTMVAHTVPLPAAGELAIVFEADGLRVTAFPVDHAPATPAYGYRFDYRGRSVVISGDTRKSDNLIHHAHGADLLLHEGLAAHMIEPVTAYARAHNLSRWAKLTSDIVGYHTTPVQAAEVAKAANVRMLAFTHMVPPLPNFIARWIFLRGVSKAWNGEVVIGADGMHFELAPGVTAVVVHTLS